MNYDIIMTNDFEGKNVILVLLEQGAIGCSGRHWVKSCQKKIFDCAFTKKILNLNLNNRLDLGLGDL